MPFRSPQVRTVSSKAIYRASAIVTELVEFMCARGRPLFHGTDESHLCSIAENGLLSESKRRQEGIEPMWPGGDARTRAFDEDFRLNNYVFLGFSTAGLMPAHKEEKRRRRPRLLHIHASVLLFPDVKLALGRDSRARWKIYGVHHALHSIDDITFEIFRRLLEGNSNWDDVELQHRWRINHVMDFEVLVPSRVSPDLIELA